MINKILLKIFTIFSSPIFARIDEPPVDEPPGPPRLKVLATAFDKVFSWIFPLGVLISVSMIIYGGYMWMISGGEPQRKQQAQGTLTWAVLGLVFLLLTRALLEIILGKITS